MGGRVTVVGGIRASFVGRVTAVSGWAGWAGSQREGTGFGDGRVADVFIRDPFATQPNSPFPSPMSWPRPRNNAVVPDHRSGAPEGVSDAPPCCAAHAPRRGGARLDRDSTSPPAQHAFPKSHGLSPASALMI